MAAPKEMAAPKSPQSGFDEVEEMKDAPELSIDDSVNLAEYQGKTVVLDNLYNKLTLLSAQVNKGKEQREQVYVFELSSRIIKLKSKVNDLKTQKNKLRAEMQKFLKINKI